jgi:hypothetical protein
MKSILRQKERLNGRRGISFTVLQTLALNECPHSAVGSSGEGGALESKVSTSTRQWVLSLSFPSVEWGKLQ